MNARNIIIPIITAAAGFAAGWFAHRHYAADQTAKALKQQANYYDGKLKEANKLFQSVTYEDALNRLGEAEQEDAKADLERWRSTLNPGVFTVSEYENMFKVPAPPEALKDEEPNDKTRKEGADVRPEPDSQNDDDILMDWRGDPIDREDDIPPEADEAYIKNDALVEPIRYVSPEEFGQAFGFQEVNLKVYTDGIVSDDCYNVIPHDEAIDLLGEDYSSHFGEYEDEAMWVMNNSNRTYYEVIYDGRTYREAIGRG